MFMTQPVKRLLVECPVVPQPLHFCFKAGCVEVAQHVYQGVQLLLILRSCK